jgi:tetratricopeptide (TPR) repeat protein
MEDVFDLEDRVTENVVGVLEPQIRKAEIERVRRKRPENLDAYGLFMRALPHAYAMTQEDNAIALGFLEEAMRLDPGFVPARAFAAWCYEERLTRRWPNALEDDADRAVRLAHEVLAADTDDANVIAIAGFVLVMVGRRYDSGLEALRHAVELNPNNAFVLMNAGWAEAFAGDLARALGYLERARLLNPRDPAAFYVLTGLGFVNILMERYEEAVEFAAKSAAVYDGWDATYFVLGMALGCSGRKGEARQAISRLLELLPTASISHHRRALPIRDPDRFAALERCMRAAGLPVGHALPRT